MVLECKPGSLTRKLRLGESRNQSKVTLLVGVGARIQMQPVWKQRGCRQGSEGVIQKQKAFLSWFCCPLSMEARPALPREGKREWGGRGRALTPTDFCLNGQVHTAGIRSWAFTLRRWSFPCWPWLAPGISASLKPLPIRGWFSCSLPRLLIRGCLPLKTQLGSSSLVLSWDGFKGWKAICSFCVEGRGVWEGVLQLAGELIRPSNCLVISQVTWKPSERREWGGWRSLCAQQAARCLCASGRFGKWGLGRPVLKNPQKIYQMDSPRVVALYLHPAADGSKAKILSCCTFFLGCLSVQSC